MRLSAFALVLTLIMPFNLWGQTSPVSRSLRIMGTELKPYTWTNENLEVVGLLPELLKRISEKLGRPAGYELFPWARAQVMVQDGDADGFVGTISPERSAFADPGSVPLVPVNVHGFYLTTNKKIPSPPTLESFKGLTGGAILGNTWAINNLQNKGFPLTSAKDMASLVQMLLLGRIDYIPENEIILRAYLKELGIRENVDSLLIDKTAMYLYIGKNSPFLQLRREIDQVIQEIHFSGEYEKMERKYR